MFEIDRLCRSIVPGAGSIDVEPLGAGLTGETYRVVRDGAAYALKIAAEPRGSYMNLPWQMRVLEHAAVAGLAPRLVYHSLDGRVLLSSWVEGRSWASHAVAASEHLRAMAGLLRRVHALAAPTPVRQMTPLQWIEIYEELSKPTPGSYDPALRRAALARAESLLRLPRAAGVLCHSDLHVMNLLQLDGALILLDWEYAHVTDPLWDLAGWCANNDFSAETQWSMVSLYLGNAPIPDQWQRFRLLLALYDYVCLLWSHVYLSVRGEEGNSIAKRARLLDARLRLPANYAA